MDLEEDPDWNYPLESNSEVLIDPDFYGTKTSDEDPDCPTKKKKRKFPRYFAEKKVRILSLLLGNYFQLMLS